MSSHSIIIRWTFSGQLTDERGQKDPLSKISHTYSTKLKFGTVITYLKKIHKKYMNHVTYPLSSADRIFLLYQEIEI